MKVQLYEHGGCFSIQLEAETMKEAAVLTRFGMNHTRDIRFIGSSVFDTGSFDLTVTIGKHRRADSSVPRRK